MRGRQSVIRKPPDPPTFAGPRPPAAHVLAGMGRTGAKPVSGGVVAAGGIQAKATPGAARPLAPHVGAAIQRKAEGSRAALGPASHVQKAIQATRAPAAPIRALPPAATTAAQPFRPLPQWVAAMPVAPIRPAPGRGSSPPIKPAVARPPAPRRAPVVQPMSLLSWLFSGEKVSQEEYEYNGNGESLNLRVSDKPTKKGKARTVNITLGTAKLDGEIEIRGIAWINTVANPGPAKGKGVSYLLIRRFAEVAQQYQATSVKLGTAVNRASVANMGQTPADVKERPGAEAALHVYSELGYNVATRESVDASSRTAEQLIAGTTTKMGGKWVSVEEQMAVASTLLEQALIGLF